MTNALIMKRIDAYKIIIRKAIEDGYIENQGDLAKKMGYSGNSAFSQIINNKVAEPKDFISRLLLVVPNMDVSLLDGTAIKPNSEQTPNGNSFLPLVPINALAGLPSLDNEGVCLDDCDRYAVPDFCNKGAQFLIRVSGNSMVPTYNNGDLLACKQITDISFFQWGRIYVLDTDQGALVKRLKRSNGDGCVTCHSDNEDDYPEFDLPLSSIRKYFIVIGLIRVE